jgi:hypothetical protein
MGARHRGWRILSPVGRGRGAEQSETERGSNVMRLPCWDAQLLSCQVRPSRSMSAMEADGPQVPAV